MIINAREVTKLNKKTNKKSANKLSSISGGVEIKTLNISRVVHADKAFSLKKRQYSIMCL